MDARAKTIRDILYSRDQYLVPFFQRHYSWRKSDWERLWRDIEGLVEDGATRQHFLGPLVCTPLEHVPSEVSRYQLIDGQQRLTTLTILLAALRDLARERGEADAEDEINEDYLTHKREKGWTKLKVLPRTGDREVLSTLIEGKKLTKEHRRDRIAKGYRFFRKALAAHVDAADNARQAVKAVLNAMTGRLSLVVITITGENPYEIFESLNSTGLPLEESDLIRNYIFMQVPLDQQDKFHEEVWQPFEESFEATTDLPPLSPTAFYRSYLMREGVYSRKGATFADFKAQHPPAASGPAECLAGLSRFAEYERLLRFPQTCEDEGLRGRLEEILRLELTTAHPLVMRLLELKREGTLPAADLDGCLHDLASFVLRRSLCSESTRGYGRWFVSAARDLDGDARERLREEWLRRGWPDDASVARAVADFALYRREPRKARLLLERLERAAGHKEQVKLDGLQIEHVMPQTIKDDDDGRAWKAVLGDEWQDDHVNLLHTLGNLTLTGYNPELSKRPFDFKKGILTESHLELNRHFGDLTAWRGEDIRQRTERLAGELCQLWPRPLKGPDYSLPEEAMAATERPNMTASGWLDYWQEFAIKADADPALPTVRNKSRSYVRFPTGRRHVYLTARAYEKGGWLLVALRGRGKKGQPIIDALRPMRGLIEEKLGVELVWKDGALEIWHGEVPIADQTQWAEQHDWLLGMLLRVMEVVRPLLKGLDESGVLAGPEDESTSAVSGVEDEDVLDDEDDEDDEDEDGE